MRARIHMLAGAVGCALAGSASAALMNASRVEFFSQGLRADGAAVMSERSDPTKALGAPELTDTLNFVSLGFGGTIVLGFDAPFNHSVQIIETTYDNPALHPEACEVYVGVGASWDTATYYFVGVRQNTEDDVIMSLSGANLASGVQEYNFLKIVDLCDRDLLPGSADGYDVDGVFVPRSDIPAPAGGVLALMGLAAAGRRRRDVRLG